MKFLIDMPLSPALADFLVRRGHDAHHVAELGLARASDLVILDRARSERCVVITADLDYPRLLASAGIEGPGLILFRRGDYSERESLERLTRVLETIPSEELSGCIVVIEKGRIRRRRLPVERRRQHN